MVDVVHLRGAGAIVASGGSVLLDRFDFHVRDADWLAGRCETEAALVCAFEVRAHDRDFRKIDGDRRVGSCVGQVQACDQRNIVVVDALVEERVCCGIAELPGGLLDVAKRMFIEGEFDRLFAAGARGGECHAPGGEHAR